MEALVRYSWPANVRELRNAIEGAVALCRSERIGLRDLPVNVRGQGGGIGAGGSAKSVIEHKNLTVKEAEKQLILRALEEHNGNRTLAAKKIGMSRRTLHRKLHDYHLGGF